MPSIDLEMKKIIKTYINNYIDKISDTCHIDKHILKEIWKEINKPIKKEKIKNDYDYNDQCIYIFTRGHKAGERCNKKSRKNKKCCSQHKNFEDNNILLNKNPKQIIIKKNKIIDKYCHNQTGMVFKSKDDKIVIGKLIDNSIQKLNDEDILICKTWGFNFKSDS